MDPVILTKASIVVMSHLSDAALNAEIDPFKARRHIEFSKFIILKTKSDLTQEINPDELWTEFAKRWKLPYQKA